MTLFKCSCLGFVFLMISIHISHGINLGLIAGDNKHTGAPVIIKKYTRHNPITINIKRPQKVPIAPRLKPPKPPPTRVPRALPLFPKPLPFFLPPILPLLPPPIILPPLLPKLPMLTKIPILPPKLPVIPLRPIFYKPTLPMLQRKLRLLAPKIPLLPPKIPLLPPKLCPLTPKLPKSMRLLKAKLKKSDKPLRVPLLKKPARLTALGSESKPTKVPAPTSQRNEVLKLLLDIKKRGGLTSAEYSKIRKLLIR